jgi:hypothetical protein
MPGIPLPPGTPLVPGPAVQGYSTSATEAAVDGSNLGGSRTTQTSSGGTVTTELQGSGAYGLLAGVDKIFSQHAGVYGESDQQGVFGTSTKAGGTGVYGYIETAGFALRAEVKGGGTAISGKSLDGAGLAASFEGNATHNGDLTHTGNLTLNGNLDHTGTFELDGPMTMSTGGLTLTKGDITLTGADCAEDFGTALDETLAPGSVVIMGSDGNVRLSECSYDKAVVGVISGAGDFQPAMILGRPATSANRAPVALIGRVNCLVDANYSSIEIGDLLTTSPTPGHAMKVTDPGKAVGTVIGKALRPLDCGKGLIPILVCLQ